MSPEKSKIGPEEWPYQLSGFEVKESIEAQFPGILPDMKLAETHEVRKGFQVFFEKLFCMSHDERRRARADGTRSESSFEPN